MPLKRDTINSGINDGVSLKEEGGTLEIAVPPGLQRAPMMTTHPKPSTPAQKPGELYEKLEIKTTPSSMHAIGDGIKQYRKSSSPFPKKQAIYHMK